MEQDGHVDVIRLDDEGEVVVVVVAIVLVRVYGDVDAGFWTVGACRARRGEALTDDKTSKTVETDKTDTRCPR